MTGGKNPLPLASPPTRSVPWMTVAQPGEQRGCRLIRWVLRHQPALERSFQDRLAQRPVSVLQGSEPVIDRNPASTDALDDALPSSSRTRRTISCISTKLGSGTRVSSS